VSARGWVLFVALALIWGVPYLFIRVAVQEMSPATLVFLRTAPAALLLLPLALRRGRLRAVFARWHWVLALALAEFTIPWLLVSHAEQRMTSSMAGLLIATVPLMVAAIARFGPAREHLGVRRLAGLLVGFGGVVFLVGLDLGTLDLLAVVEVMVAALLYAAGPFIISDRLAGVPSIAAATAGLAFTAVVYSPFVVIDPPTGLSTDAIVSVAVLAVACSALAFVLFFWLIREVGPSRSTVFTYINPAVALALGVLILDEPFTVGIAVGFPLVILGSILATSRSRPVDSPEPPGSHPA